MRKSLKQILLGSFLSLVISSQINADPISYRSKFDIIILYTNDVHCFVDNNIGYAGLVAYKKDMLKETPYVSLVDCGDHLQGNITGSASKGAYIVDIMNKAKYEFATIGNHEFDYGLPELTKRLKSSKTKYLNCNAVYTGKYEDPFATTASYTIRPYGLNKVGFIGIVTPRSISSSTPAYFQENGQYVVNLKGKNNGQELFDAVQETVNACKKDGAKYIVALSHLGTNLSHAPFNSKTLIANTTGIDVVLDGHSHSTIPGEKVYNKEGKPVLLTSTGTALEKIGKLTINASGIKSELITGYEKKDPQMKAFIDNIKNNLGENLNKVIGTSNQTLSINDENGVRLVRNRECNIGNWVADAMAFEAQTEIGMCNGGGIRANLKEGKITFGDIYALHTFNNTLIKAKITGQQLLNILENSYRFVSKESVGPDGSALNENGGFLQISGLKLTIDTSVNPKEGNRVKNVMTLVNGQYEPLDLQKTYAVAAPDYLATKGKNGNNRIFEEDILEEYGILPEAFVHYCKYLNGNFSKYNKTEDRITVK